MKWHKKLTIIASSAVISAAAFTSVASAETIKVGLMLKKGFPGAEPVNGMYEFFKLKSTSFMVALLANPTSG